MDDFLRAAFSVVDPVTAAGLFAVGIVYGLTFLAAVIPGRSRDTWALAGMAMTGLVFCTYASTSRAFQGVLEWPRWIGVGFLWLVYSVGAFAGLRWRHRRR